MTSAFLLDSIRQINTDFFDLVQLIQNLNSITKQDYRPREVVLLAATLQENHLDSYMQDIGTSEIYLLRKGKTLEDIRCKGRFPGVKVTLQKGAGFDSKRYYDTLEQGLGMKGTGWYNYESVQLNFGENIRVGKDDKLTTNATYGVQVGEHIDGILEYERLDNRDLYPFEGLFSKTKRESKSVPLPKATKILPTSIFLLPGIKEQLIGEIDKMSESKLGDLLTN